MPTTINATPAATRPEAAKRLAGRPPIVTKVSTRSAPAPVKAVDVMPVLLSELQKAEQIILAMLNAMTSAQKSKVAARLDAADVSGEGMTRYHERRAAIDAAEAVSAQVAIVHAQSKPPDLTPAELSLLVSFRQMRGETQKAMVHAFKNMAMDPTIRRVQLRHLRLVVGDAS